MGDSAASGRVGPLLLLDGQVAGAVSAGCLYQVNLPGAHFMSCTLPFPEMLRSLQNLLGPADGTAAA